MAIKAESYKNWCTENISPQSWARILLKSLDVVRAEGLTLKQMENPGPELDLPEDLLEALNQALEEIYQTKIEESLLDIH